LLRSDNPWSCQFSNLYYRGFLLQETSNSELPAAGMKLIHSGKVLKDEDAVESCNIKPNDFLVVMISKAKKPAATPAPAATSITPATPAPASANTTETPAPAPAAEAAAAAPPAPARPSADDFPRKLLRI
jgi:hypothetical protein